MNVLPTPPTGLVVALLALGLVAVLVLSRRRRRARARGLQPFDLDLIRWRCDVCRAERPDRLIDVVRIPLWEPGIDVPIGWRNVKHCTDRARCRESAERMRSCAYFALGGRKRAQRREDVGP